MSGWAGSVEQGTPNGALHESVGKAGVLERDEVREEWMGPWTVRDTGCSDCGPETAATPRGQGVVRAPDTEAEDDTRKPVAH